MAWGAFGGALAFGLSQVVTDFAWLVPFAVAAADYWCERRRRGFGRAGLAALLIVLSSFVSEVVIGASVWAFFGS